MMRSFGIVLALVSLGGCSGSTESASAVPAREPGRSDSEAFKRGGAGRAASWEKLEPLLASSSRSVPRTKVDLRMFFEDWLGPSEPAAFDRCKHLVQWALSPQQIDRDVLCYLLEDKDGFRDYLIIDFRNPEKLRVDVASTVEAPKSKDPVPTAEELAIAKQVGAVEVNVSGAGDDGGPKPGWSVWFKEGEAGPEQMRKACQLPKLAAVLLTGKGVTNDWLAPLKGHAYVTSIRLFETSVTDEGLAFLEGLSSLRFVMLKKCPVTERGVAALKAALPKCKVDRD